MAQHVAISIACYLIILVTNCNAQSRCPPHSHAAGDMCSCDQGYGSQNGECTYGVHNCGNHAHVNTQQTGCVCDENYWVSDSTGECEYEEPYCSGPNETKDCDDSGGCNCHCNDGYTWSAAAQADPTLRSNLCVIASADTVDCGPTAHFDGEGCSCNTGYSLNDDRSDCILVPGSQGCACAAATFIDGQFSHNGCGTGIDLTQYGCEIRPKSIPFSWIKVTFHSLTNQYLDP